MPLPTQKNPDPVISVHGLGVRRDGNQLLDDITWEVKAGEHWVILGPNGSGKSTLLKILCGHMAPTIGEFSVFGDVYGQEDWNTVRPYIGVVSHSLGTRVENHETAQDLVLSGKYGQVNFWGKSSSQDRAEASRMLAEVGCAGREAQTWETLSQGERQRLLIGRALMAQLKLLILDEPCAGLDPVARDAFLNFLGDLLRKGKIATCILVTHHVEEILPQFSGVLCLANGRAVAQGPRREVMKAAHMRRAYGSRVRLEYEGGRYHMKVFAPNRRLFQR